MKNTNKILGKYEKQLVTCPWCGGREFIVEQYSSKYYTGSIYVNCRKCPWFSFGRDPVDVIRNIKSKKLVTGRSIPKSFRHLHATKPARVATRRYERKLKENPEALPVEAHLFRKCKNFVYDYF